MGAVGAFGDWGGCDGGGRRGRLGKLGPLAPTPCPAHYRGGGNAVSGQGRSHCLERGQRAIQIKKAFKKKAEKLFEPSLFRSALGGLCALGHAFVLFRIGRVPRLRDFFGLLGRVASSLNGIPDGAPR